MLIGRVDMETLEIESHVCENTFTLMVQIVHYCSIKPNFNLLVRISDRSQTMKHNADIHKSWFGKFKLGCLFFFLCYTILQDRIR